MWKDYFLFFRRSDFLLFRNLCLFILAFRFFSVELIFQMPSSFSIRWKAVRRLDKLQCDTKVSNQEDEVVWTEEKGLNQLLDADSKIDALCEKRLRLAVERTDSVNDIMLQGVHLTLFDRSEERRIVLELI